MPKAMAILLLMQLLGECAVRLLHMPVPGPVVGMMLMFFWLVWMQGPDKEVAGTVHVLLQNLTLLFVPAGVGIMEHGARLQKEGWGIILVLVVSTLLTMMVTVVSYHYLSRWVKRMNPSSGDGSGARS